MDLDALAAVIGPPPPAPFPVDCPGVERWLGLRLPDDYKAFAERYGPVLAGEWIWVVVPHQSDRGGYVRQIDERQGAQRSIRADHPASHPSAFHPEPGGLLVWGESRGSEYYFWDTSVSADPGDWPTRIFVQEAGRRAAAPRTWGAGGLRPGCRAGRRGRAVACAAGSGRTGGPVADRA